MTSTDTSLPVAAAAPQLLYLQRQFTRRRASIGRVRTSVRQAIAGHLPTDRVEDVVLCASELATNALRHTPSGRDFRVRLALEGGVLRLEVHDAGDGSPRVCEAAEDDDHGRGLFLVAALADSWGTSRRDGPGKLVWAAFRFPGWSSY
ncbi:ATP-binding protein [Streptomyces cavernicola]|uniref:ATP-binding protein n=1 Tax=Streptomyces cavernicola TaxID=3043613 RepID=A0ABT6SMW8_9ACTN|nr:ATP-binding protein [Streptomyces sp. B-S-A6]MDI3409513.1 ATP-binding protein [Streptomyces sp. B-S-A6]